MGASAYDRRLAASGLPPAVLLCLAGAGPELRRAALEVPGFLPGLAAFFAAAGETLGLPPEEALSASGYRAGDVTPGRLEAALAELGAALFLRGEGFEEIRAVPRAAGRTADLSAVRAGREYHFEVRFVGGELGSVKRLAAKFGCKSAQVRTSLKRRGGGGGGVIFVAGLPGAGPQKSCASLDRTAAAVHASCGGKSLHVCLIAGEGRAVYPPW